MIGTATGPAGSVTTPLTDLAEEVELQYRVFPPMKCRM